MQENISNKDSNPNDRKPAAVVIEKSPQSVSRNAIRFTTKRFIVGAAVILALVAGIGLLLNNASQDISAKNTYVLDGTAEGRGMEFNRYNLFGKPSDTKGLPSSVKFVQTKKSEDNKTTVNVAKMAAVARDMSSSASGATTGGPSPEYAKTLRANLSKSVDSTEYIFATKTIKAFAQSSVGKEIFVNLGPAQPYTNETIKTDAWEFSVNTVGNSFDKIQPQKGKAVIAIGKNTYYYFIVTVTDDYMAPNTQTVSQIVDSLKIDQ